MYRYFTEPHVHYQWIAWIAGAVQTGMFIDFFYYFWKSVGLEVTVLPQ